MEAHNEAVSVISKQLQEFYARKEAFRVYHGSTNTTRAVRRDNIVDTSQLDSVLSIDTTRKTALVEPNVSMDKLVEAALKVSLVPLVVMEFPGITVGGGFSGSAGESSSGRHGPFDSTVNSIEIVLANGDVMQASKTDNCDLFWGAASAFGTLGIVTSLEVQLQDATRYVQLTHYPLRTFKETSEKLREVLADDSVEYVDGIIFSPNEAVVCVGRLTDALPMECKPRRYLGSSDPWFYLDVQKRVMKAPEPIIDYVPLVDYLFRWDRGGFWVARYAYRYLCAPFNRITRYALDTFMHARVMYHALHKSGLSDSYIIQDVGVPFDSVEIFYEWLHEKLNIYPLWLCPIRVRRYTPDAAHGLHAHFAEPSKTPEVMLNFGVWGPGPSSYKQLKQLNRMIEHKVHELRGNKTLYAQSFYTEQEFWQSYDRPAYDRVRDRYHAAHLPSVYDKVKVDENAKSSAKTHSRLPNILHHTWPFQGLYGVYKAWRGGDYLLPKKSKS